MLRLKTLIFLICAICTFKSFAATNNVTIDGYTYTIDVDNMTATVKAAEKPTGDIVIPATVNCFDMDFTIVGLTDNAFEGATELTSLSLPNTIQRIGDYAMSGCSNLKRVEMPSSVTYLGASAFCGCRKLESIDLPGSIVTIGSLAFKDCGLRSIYLPAAISEIGSDAFDSCDSLKEVSASDLYVFGQIKFSNRKANPLSIAETFLINGESPKHLTLTSDLNTYAFIGYKFETITLPANISDTSLVGLEDLQCDKFIIEDSDETLNLSNFVHEGFSHWSNSDPYGNTYFYVTDLVKFYVFSDLKCEVIYIGRDLSYSRYVDWDSFNWGNSSIDVSNNYSGYKDEIMYYCGDNFYFESLAGKNQPILGTRAKISFGPKVTSISSVVVSNLRGSSPWHYESVDFDNMDQMIKFSENLEVKTDNPLHNSDVVYVDGKEFNVWDIPEGTAEVTTTIFAGWDGLKGLNIPESVTAFGESVFEGCDGLTSLKFPNSVKTVGANSFCNCSGLASVRLGKSMRQIGESAFDGCLAITDVYALSTIPPAIESTSFADVTKQTATLHVPKKALAYYMSDDEWSKFENIVGEEDDELMDIEEVVVAIDPDTDCQIYNINGTMIFTGSQNEAVLPAGLYIVRQGETVTKIAVR